MTDKMTLNEFDIYIRELSKLYAKSEDIQMGMSIVLGKLKDNRPALEVGMRGVLRFKMNKTSDMCLLDLQGDPWILPGYTRSDVSKLAESIGMSAEFVEDQCDAS